MGDYAKHRHNQTTLEDGRRVPRIKGSRGAGRDTDASHILSFEVLDAALDPRGRGPSEKKIDKVADILNRDDNIRIKTRAGNTFTRDEHKAYSHKYSDSALDAEISGALRGDGRLHSQAAANRAARQHEVWERSLAGDDGTVDIVGERLGKLTFSDGGRGRPHKMKNYEPSWRGRDDDYGGSRGLGGGGGVRGDAFGGNSFGGGGGGGIGAGFLNFDYLF